MKFIITYLKNNKTDELEGDDFIILGREHSGKELFEDINYIGRKHCMLENKEGKWIIRDADSINGTYIIKRNNLAEILDCKLSEECLEDGDILVLGKEKFLVNLVVGKKPNEELIEESIKIIYCINPECSIKLEQKGIICPACNTYNP